MHKPVQLLLDLLLEHIEHTAVSDLGLPYSGQPPGLPSPGGVQELDLAWQQIIKERCGDEGITLPTWASQSAIIAIAPGVCSERP